jgi:NAD kinase
MYIIAAINVRLLKKMNIKCSFDEEEFEDTKEVIRILISKKDRQHKSQKKKGQTTIYKILHIKLNIE